MVKVPICRATEISIHAPPRGATRRERMRHATPRHFNSRPSARGDRPRSRVRLNPRISIHAPPRGATNRRDARPAVPTFQFTPLREGRPTRSARPRGLHFAFQFTPLREGRQKGFAPGKDRKIFQFTPLREGRRFRLSFVLVASRISIHAPPRGATQAPTSTAAGPPHFNSRPSARGDNPAERRNTHGQISIHAPPRGATPRPGKASGMHLISIHAPPRGATQCHHRVAHAGQFQFTPLREGRRRCARGGRQRTDFNSRPSARGDSRATRRKEGTTIFQFTPLREGRRSLQVSRAFTRLFQFTPLREGRRGKRFQIKRRRNEFQFTPLREGRQQKICNFCKSFVQPLQISMA